MVRNPELSVTMASYNSVDVTLQTLQSLYACANGIETEVIVVDNGSSDGSPDAIERYYPDVRVVRSRTNLGFAAAQNLALSMSRGPYVLLLNSDVLFVGDALRTMLDCSKRLTFQLGVVGPRALNLDGSIAPTWRKKAIYPLVMVGLSAINQYFPFGHLLPMSLLRRFGRVLGKVHDLFDPPVSSQLVEWVDGMCVMFRREVLETTGLFDEQYFFNFEIGDLLFRVREAGWKILFEPAATIIHLGGYTRKRNPWIAATGQRSLLVFYAKHVPHHVSFVRKLYMAIIWLKLCQVRFQSRVGQSDCFQTSQEKVLVDSLEMFTSFRADAVIANTRIPRLVVTPRVPSSGEC